MNIVTEDTINPKQEYTWVGKAPTEEELALQKEATEKVAAKISEIFEKLTNAQQMPGADKLPNIPGHLYKLETSRADRGHDIATAHFHIPVVYGERADRDAHNSWKRVDALHTKLVHPLRGAGFLASNPHDAGHMPRKNAWKDPNGDAGGFTAEFLISAPENMTKAKLQKVLSWISSQG